MNKRLLFVDDEQRVLDALCRMLHAHRSVWDLICVNDPRVAWEELQHGHFDAVVSDIRMPGMSGLELLEHIKQSDRVKETPVVILTGLEDRSLKRQALDLGAADLLNKPVDPEDLVARLRSVLRLKACLDTLRGHKSMLEDKVQERTAELYRSRMDVIWRLCLAAEHRDDNTGNHVTGRFKTSHCEALQNQPILFTFWNVTDPFGNRQVPCYSTGGGSADSRRAFLPSLTGCPLPFDSS